MVWLQPPPPDEELALDELELELEAPHALQLPWASLTHVESHSVWQQKSSNAQTHCSIHDGVQPAFGCGAQQSPSGPPLELDATLALVADVALLDAVAEPPLPFVDEVTPAVVLDTAVTPPLPTAAPPPLVTEAAPPTPAGAPPAPSIDTHL
jgi:hypothetical protein